MRRHSEYALSSAQSSAWGRPGLAGNPVTWLANELGEPWLQVIALPGLEPVDPFHHRGWFSLEINVESTDKLCPSLESSVFEVIGAPANLEVSDAIRAMQAIGPAGEVLYLTEVKAEVPPFELPFARCAVDRLFIPVMLTSDRDRSLRTYAELAGNDGLLFDTRITVINRARGLAIDTRHPVATLQLRGANLIEFDQIDGLADRPEHLGLPPGIAWISFAVDSLPAGASAHTVSQGPHAGRKAAFLRGAGKELYELILIPTTEPEPEEST
jgi:hypothetical protein